MRTDDVESLCQESRPGWCGVHESPWPPREPVCERAEAEDVADLDE